MCRASSGQISHLILQLPLLLSAPVHLNYHAGSLIQQDIVCRVRIELSLLSMSLCFAMLPCLLQCSSALSIFRSIALVQALDICRTAVQARRTQAKRSRTGLMCHASTDQPSSRRQVR